MRVAVAMSGGVDSSVAAYVLKAEGHDVFGLTMRLGSWGDPSDPHLRCGPAAIRDAERVARELGIEHHTVGVEARFERDVVGPFVSEYARGRTPNPCARCNRLIKFGALLSEAVSMGARRFATGHHAVVHGDTFGGSWSLLRARDSRKDQTYFLYGMTQLQLSRVLMPVGELAKEDVRETAREAGLHVAERPESQDVCFLPGGDAAALLRKRCPSAVAPGPIVDLEGSVVGEHRGIALYTIGQRSGLGLSRPAPAYVVRIVPDANTLVVGGEEDLYAPGLAAGDLSWVAGRPPGARFRAVAKIRYAAPPAPCSVDLAEDEAVVSFDEPQRAVAPGQAVVFYDGDRVLGGGTILAQRPLAVPS
jgi:tRNA-specific 2-thiouridylase